MPGECISESWILEEAVKVKHGPILARFVAPCLLYKWLIAKYVRPIVLPQTCILVIYYISIHQPCLPLLSSSGPAALLLFATLVTSIPRLTSYVEYLC